MVGNPFYLTQSAGRAQSTRAKLVVAVLKFEHRAAAVFRIAM
jgi:hypothetical protein